MIVPQTSELILDLYRGAREQQPGGFREWALGKLEALVPFDSAMWGTASNDPRRMHEVYVYNQPPEMLRNYARYEDEDLIRTAVCKAPGRTVNLSDLMSPEEFARTDIYLHHASRFGICAILCSVDIQPVTGIIEVVSLWRSDLGRQFNESERQVKEFIAPHLFETCRQNRLLHIHRSQTSCDDILDAPAIAHHSGLLLDADREFVETVRKEWPDWEGDTLPRPLLGQADTNGSGAYVGSNTVTRSTTHGDLLFLTIRTKRPSDALSMREQRVAKEYAAGFTYVQVADRLNLSPTTVKSHLRRIYAKLKVNNKSQLIQVLGP